MTNQIPEEDRKELEQEAFNYSENIDLGEWRPVDKYYFAKINAAYIAGATKSSTVKNLTLGLQSAEKEIERLGGLIETVFKGTGNKVMAKIWGDDLEKHWQQFKTENNL